MNADKLIHPVYVKRGAVTPRNYVVGAHTSEDSHHEYTRRAMRSGKTVHDILTECIAARAKYELSRK
jgi:hypothetical protein